jgi:uncharacterized protein YdeI (YjbR/CyaY-like superfamily)
VKPVFFATPIDWRRWLARHHATAAELLVGFHKRGTGRPCITWPESVDQALCYGWIDGVRRSLGDSSYTIRFTPRRPGSIWSAVNLKRVAALKRQGLMRAAGLRVFAARDRKRSGLYSFEQRRAITLPPAFARRLKAEPDAWSYFQAQAPWYRRTASFWVVSAKKEETRERRLVLLIACSARGRPVGPLTR